MHMNSWQRWPSGTRFWKSGLRSQEDQEARCRLGQEEQTPDGDDVDSDDDDGGDGDRTEYLLSIEF